MPSLICRAGHLRPSQIHADNCSVCKGVATRKIKQQQQRAFVKAGQLYFDTLLGGLKSAIIVAKPHRFIAQVDDYEALVARLSTLKFERKSKFHSVHIIERFQQLEQWQFFNHATNSDVVLLSLVDGYPLECIKSAVVCSTFTNHKFNPAKSKAKWDSRKWLVNRLSRSKI